MSLSAGSRAGSFQQANKDLRKEAEQDISDQRILRAAKQFGPVRIVAKNSWRGSPQSETCIPAVDARRYMA